MRDIHPNVRQKFMPFMDKMVSLHGQSVISVFLYGSAAGENYIPKVSDINSAFIFKDISSTLLRKSHTLIADALRQRIATPLFLTLDYIRVSLDVFPIEFLDMKEHHIVLYGEDLLKDLEIQTGHLRLFCEQQLKGKFIRIRQAYLEIGGKPPRMEALLKDSMNSLFPVLRNLLRLKGYVPPVNKEQILKDVSREFQLDEGLWLAIYHDRKNDGRIGKKNLDNVIMQYLTQIENLTARVDQL